MRARPRLGVSCLRFEDGTLGLGGGDVVGPRRDDSRGPLGPALDHDVELLEELATEHEPGQAFGECPFAVEVCPGDSGAITVPVVAPRVDAVECREDVVLGAVFGVEQFDQRLELEHGPGAGLRYPRRHRSPALGGDRVNGAGPPARRLLRGAAARWRRASSVPRTACSRRVARTGRGHVASAGRARRSSMA